MKLALDLALAPALIVALVGVGCDAADHEQDQDQDTPPQEVRYRVTLENVSAPGALMPSSGDPVDIMISPGVWVVHDDDDDDGDGALVPGEPASAGVERLAEDGEPAPLAQEMGEVHELSGSFGAMDPQDDYATAPLVPGMTVSFELQAMSDQRLSMLSMFIHSNDIVVATGPDGVALDMAEVDETVDVTSLALFDAGTERNEEPGIGPNQPMQQAEHDTGQDEGGVVTRVDGVDAEGFEYPGIDTFLRVSLTRL